MVQIQANLVLEILGRPKEHVLEALETLVVKMGSEKGIKIIEKNIHDPIPIENSKDLFTTFAELVLEFETLNNYFGILFAYMPSHIELINPEKTILTNIDLNDLANKILSRLHDYDAITKKALFEREIALTKLKEVSPELVKEISPAENKIAEEPKIKKANKKKIKRKD